MPGKLFINRFLSLLFLRISPSHCLHIDQHGPADTLQVMNGLTAARCIRKLEREGKLRRHIPIIAITANARAEQRDEALEAGMDSVITKPFRVPDVVEKMKYWILETDARRVDEWKNPAGR